MKIPSILALALLAFAATQTPAEAQATCGPRVRRNWNALSDADKATYKGAIASAMDSGAYIKFVQIHQEDMSNAEAHHQCMFIYWHRYYLVAFENMLRAQGDEFSCVTIPYFNWVEANSRFMSSECSTFGDCAAITSELGGFTSGATEAVSINGDSAIEATCVNEWPLDHFCQSSTPGTACSGCVPRGDWGSTPMPSETEFANVRSEVFGSRSITGMSSSVEGNSHASVHSALGAAMGTFASPADPIFWSHHSMVDALHTIFHKCRVGTQRMSFEEKAENSVAWESCSRVDAAGRPTGVPFNPTDVVTVRTGFDANSTSAREDPVVSKFFEDVPNRFADLMDIRDLGGFSYTYELSGQLASMYTECDGTSAPSSTAPVATTTAPAATTRAPAPTTAAPAPTTRAPEPTSTNAPEPTSASTPAPTPTSASVTVSPSEPSTPPATTPTTENLGNNQQMEDARRFFEWLWGNLFPNSTRSFRRLAAEDELDNTDFAKQQGDSKTPAPSKGPYDDGKVDVIIIDESGESEQRVLTWYKETATAMGGLSAETIADLGRQSCMYYDQCLGGVTDFSDEFKAIWGVKEARCKTIVDAVNCGDQSIVYSKWREDMEAHFGCPKPAKATTQAPSDQDQTSQTDQQQIQTQEQQQAGDGNIAEAITGAIAQLTQSA